MRTVQMTLEDDLIKKVDRVARQLKSNRSAFTREALRRALARHEEQRKEQKHREGYAKKPVRPGEFSVWESEQVWGDE